MRGFATRNATRLPRHLAVAPQVHVSPPAAPRNRPRHRSPLREKAFQIPLDQ